MLDIAIHEDAKHIPTEARNKSITGQYTTNSICHCSKKCITALMTQCGINRLEMIQPHQ